MGGRGLRGRGHPLEEERSVRKAGCGELLVDRARGRIISELALHDKGEGASFFFDLPPAGPAHLPVGAPAPAETSRRKTKRGWEPGCGPAFLDPVQVTFLSWWPQDKNISQADDPKHLPPPPGEPGVLGPGEPRGETGWERLGARASLCARARVCGVGGVKGSGKKTHWRRGVTPWMEAKGETRWG